MNDFYTYLKNENNSPSTPTMDGAVKDDKVGCELCPNEEVGKAGECKFEKGASPEPGTTKDSEPVGAVEETVVEEETSDTPVKDALCKLLKEPKVTQAENGSIKDTTDV